ncbi:glycosyltransferase family 2 protein, partial [Lactococcus lactis]
MKFSVIIPVYNASKFIDYCVESVLSQSYSDIEVILINDGSTDKSGEICEGFARKDNRVKVYHQENQGAAVARNHGIRKATGDYLLFP